MAPYASGEPITAASVGGLVTAKRDSDNCDRFIRDLRDHDRTGQRGLAEAAEKSWRRLDGHSQLPIEVVTSQAQAAAA
jgi:hypothetical protein